MKILHISTSDGDGGAARAAHRLHAGLLQVGHDSRMIVRKPVLADPAVAPYRASGSLRVRILRQLRAMRIEADIRRYYKTRPGGLGPFTDDRSRFGRAFGMALPDCDVVNLHWASYDYLDYEGFFRCFPQRAPVVWTLHDINAFTGGCHYTEGCDRYLTGCGCCPQLGSNHERDLSAQIYARKKACFERLPDDGRFQVVAASQWTGRLAALSPLLKRFPVTVIPYGLDTTAYQPLPAQAVRQALGIEENEKVVLFVAEDLGSRRKGMSLLLQALREVKERVDGLRLVCVGKLMRMPDAVDLPMMHLGTVNDDRLQALIYSAADVFVIPSLEEAFGLTALESMACGTPVVGFGVGGIPDMVRPEQTGLLAPVGDVDALGAAIIRLLTDDSLRGRMGKVCREVALSEYTLEKQARAYERVYEGMVTRLQGDKVNKRLFVERRT